METLHKLARDIRDIYRHEANGVGFLKDVARIVREALNDPQFRIDCLDSAIASFEKSGPNWTNPPIYLEIPDPLRLSLTYWMPLDSNPPHLHRHWTVSGILHNMLVVDVFDLAFPANPTPIATYHGCAGDVGSLAPPCIHRVRNPSAFPSIMFHVFSAEEHPDVFWDAGDALPRGDPALRTALMAIASAMEPIPPRLSVERLCRLFPIGDAHAKLAIIKALAVHDLHLAYEKGTALASTLEGPNRATIASLNRRLQELLAAA